MIGTRYSSKDSENSGSLDGSLPRLTESESKKIIPMRTSPTPPPFRLASLWETPVLNPLNGKSYTLPIFNLRSQATINFHLSWLCFHVAFLSWFAFPPLIPEAIKKDLKLTQDQINNSNIVALSATLLVRWIVGPLVDRYGPRNTMVGLLVLGAIPSGLAGTANSARDLYVIRFFIGILGGTFVPCQAWTTVFFDKNVVGAANALVGGWGNMGGGTTFIIMIALYDKLSDQISSHSAWRAAFAIVPVPALLFVALITYIFGTDCPNGKWSKRHNPPTTMLPTQQGHGLHLNHNSIDPSAVEKALPDGIDREKDKDTEASPGMMDKNTADADTRVKEVTDELNSSKDDIDVAVNQALTPSLASKILLNPLTWLPALAYMTSFGLELAVDSVIANTLYGLKSSSSSSFTQTKAGYIGCIYGLLNLFTRPAGGLLGDLLYRKGGVRAKKYLTLGCGVAMGLIAVGMGVYIESNGKDSSLASIIILIIFLGIFSEMANGANFSLVPHCNSFSNGMMSGIVGGMGNLGGIWLALIFRYQPTPLGKGFWICGIFCVVVNLLLIGIPVPKR